MNFFAKLSTCFGMTLLLSFPLHAQEELERFPSQSQIEDINAGLGGAGGSLNPFPLPRMALELLKHFEGWRASAYNDPNYCTIGYGHLIALKRCEEIELGEFEDPISLEMGEMILAEDTKTARQAVIDLVEVELTDGQYGALSSFVFNVGKGNFRESTLLRLLNDGRYDLAAEQFPRWVRSGGQVFKGLQIRRQCEMALFTDLIDANDVGEFSRDLCGVSLGAAGSVVDLVDIELGE